MATYVEYHGWIVLASGHHDWTDQDWRNADHTLGTLLAAYTDEAGHDLRLGPYTNSMRTLTLNGLTEASRPALLGLVHEILTLYDNSYGELSVADESLEAHRPVHPERYEICRGVLTQA